MARKIVSPFAEHTVKVYTNELARVYLDPSVTYRHSPHPQKPCQGSIAANTRVATPSYPFLSAIPIEEMIKKKNMRRDRNRRHELQQCDNAPLLHSTAPRPPRQQQLPPLTATQSPTAHFPLLLSRRRSLVLFRFIRGARTACRATFVSR